MRLTSVKPVCPIEQCCWFLYAVLVLCNIVLAESVGPIPIGDPAAEHLPQGKKAPGVELRRLVVVPEAEGLAVELMLSGPVTPQLTSLGLPARVVVDLPNTLAVMAQHRISVDRDGAKGIRVGVDGRVPPTTRVVVDLAQPLEYEIVPGSGNNWILRLHPVRENNSSSIPVNPIGERSEGQPAQTTSNPLVPPVTEAMKPSTTDSSQRLTLLESLESTLANEPQLHIQRQQVEISRAQKQQASGQFDLTLAGSFSQQHTNSPLTISERALVLAEGFTPTSNMAQNLSTLNVGVTKLYRTGVQISPFYQTTRTTDNLTTIQGTNISRIGFQVTIPLLRGRGREAVAAQEKAAGYEVSASLYDLNQTISDLFAATASSYWQAVAATKQLQVAQSSEERGRTYVENVQTLIQADRVAKAEINQAVANLATRTADRIAAEQNLIRAQQQLALAMGLGIDQIARASFAFEDFPEPDLQKLPLLDTDAIAKYVQQALIRRADYLAAQRRVEESRVLLVGAQNRLKPQLNLNFEAGSSGLSEGTAPAQFFNSPYHSVQGLDAIAGTTYNFPLRNDFATGQVSQAQATLNQAQLKATDLSRRISSSVVTALSAVRNAAMQLDKARESVKSFEVALQGEREKFSLGFNSLVDVLTVEDRLTTAMTTQVSAEVSYALALTQLRSATGTIVEPDKEVHAVDRDLFFTLP